MENNAVCLSTTQNFLQDDLVEWSNRISFYILSPLSAYLSLMLIIGYFKFKNLRKSPGELILSIAVTNLILNIHWTLSVLFPDLKTEVIPCEVNAYIALFTGFANYIYNIGFVYYLNQKLQNLLKKSRITKTWKVHVVCLTFSAIFTMYMYFARSVGLNIFGSCSKAFKCESNILNGLFVFGFYLIFEIAAIRLYRYIKKGFAQAVESDTEAEKFIDHYRGYLITTTILWFSLAISVAYAELIETPGKFTEVFVVMNNISKTLQAVVLTRYRYKDPLIRRAMRKLIFFWTTQDVRDSPYRNPIAEISINDLEEDLGEKSVNISKKSVTKKGLFDYLLGSRRSSVSSDFRQSIDQHNIFERFSQKRTLDLTYSVLGSLLTICNDQNFLLDDTASTSEKLERVVTYEVNEGKIFNNIPNSQTEFLAAKSKAVDVKLNIIAPDVFSRFSKKLMQSLDFKENRMKIHQDAVNDGGKSGEFFFFTNDNNFLIKSISDEEMITLRRILPKYYDHFENNPQSLITRICGIYKVEIPSMDQVLNLIIMKSVCPLESKYVDRKFDMKGSTHDRQVLKDIEYTNLDLVKSRILKDSDFVNLNESMNVSREDKLRLLSTLKEDAEFLWKEGLIDYSIVLFYVDRRRYLMDMESTKTSVLEQDKEGAVTTSRNEEIENSPFFVRMHDNMDTYYNIGIIDFLQEFTLKKMMEKNVKKIVNFSPNLDTSSQDPAFYKTRFLKFMEQIIVSKEDL